MRSLLPVLLFAGMTGVAASARADSVPVFDVNVTFASGDVLTGTVTVLTPGNGGSATADLLLRNNGTTVASFSDTEYVTEFLVFPPNQPTTTGITFFTGSYPAVNSVELIVPTPDLYDWSGGGVCLQNSGCSYALYTQENVPRSSGGYPSTTVGVGPAVSGTFALETPNAATPEPGALWLLGTGLLAGAGVVRGRLRG